MKSNHMHALYPGEIEYTKKQENLKEGVVLPESLTNDLTALADKLGVDALFLTEKETERG